MGLIARALAGAAFRVRRVLEAADEAQKRRQAAAADNVRFHPPSRVDNLRGDPRAISVGAGSNVFGQLLVFPHGGRIAIGAHCFIGEHARVWSAASITIGDRVLLSHGVNVHDSDSHARSAQQRHTHVTEIFARGHPAALDHFEGLPVTIGDDAWLGFNSIVLKGVTIGRGAIVAAGAVVTRDVGEYEIVAGNPARVVGRGEP